MTLYESLHKLTLNSYTRDIFSLSLNELVKLLGIKPRNTLKTTVIEAIYEVLSKPAFIEKVYETLSEMEKFCVKDYMQNKGYLLEEALHRFREAYGGRHIISQQTLVSLLFIDGQMPDEFVALLKKHIVQDVPVFVPAPSSTKTEERSYSFLADEHLSKDLVNIIKLVGINSFKINKSAGFPTKAVLKKINNILVHKEYETYETGMDFSNKSTDCVRLYGLITMMIKARVLAIEETYMILGREAKSFLTLPFSEQVKKLYEAYLEDRAYEEIRRIRGMRFQPAEGSRADKPRAFLMNQLKEVEQDVWISVDAFADYLFKYHRQFITENTPYITFKRTNGYYYGEDYFEGSWMFLERAYIDIVLLEGLVPLGIVDVMAVEEEIEEVYTEDWVDRIRVTHFRLTALGAHIIGKENAYEDPTLKDRVVNALWVDEMGRVVVEDSLKKNQHEMFFDQFAMVIREGDTAYYQLNFEAALKAFNESIGMKTILLYLEKECTKPLGERIRQLLLKWEKDQSKLHIQTMTVITSEDPELIALLKNHPAVIKNGGVPLEQVIKIDAGTGSKVKKELEKQYYFCNLQRGQR